MWCCRYPINCHDAHICLPSTPADHTIPCCCFAVALLLLGCCLAVAAYTHTQESSLTSHFKELMREQSRIHQELTEAAVKEAQQVGVGFEMCYFVVICY